MPASGRRAVICQSRDCSSEAEVELEVTGLVETVLSLCAPCRADFLDGWVRMQADAAALRQRGVPGRLLSHILNARMDRGVYG
ncbi:MAG TPA: hypothetical protein VFS67_21775 [Polyangiaceae bacterium]|nr:hypothetical protein [Polyangiaceae bacterium]